MAGAPDDGMRQRGTPTHKMFSGSYHRSPHTTTVMVYKPPKRFKDDNAQAKDGRLSKAERAARRKQGKRPLPGSADVVKKG